MRRARKAARLEGAADRRGRPRQPGGALPGRRRRGHHRPRRLRRRRRQQPPAPDPPHDRSGRGAQGRVGADRDQRAQPRDRRRPARGDARRRQRRRGSSTATTSILDGTDTFETRYILNDAAVAAGIPVIHASVFRFEGQLTTFVPFEGPCYRCLYPTPPPPELAPGCSVAGVLGVVPGHPRPAPDERGAQGPARDRQHARRPAAAVRRARDRVHRAPAPPRPAVPGLLRRRRRGAHGGPAAGHRERRRAMRRS